MIRPVILASAVLAVSASLTASEASGVDFGIQPVALGAGARALGMGGAFSAVADDATAVTWNPAGLTQCERPEAAVSLGWFHTNITGEDVSTSRQTQRLDHVSGLLPFFAFGCQQVVGIAWQRQYDFKRSNATQADFVDPGGDYSNSMRDATESSGSFASLGVSYAIELRPGWSCGVTLNCWGDKLTQASHYRSDLDARVHQDLAGLIIDSRIERHAEVRVASGTSLVLGTFWQATPALTLALVAKPSYHLHLEGSAHVRDVSSAFGNETVLIKDLPIDADLRHPASLTLGAAWRENDTHTISGDVTGTRWRQYRIDDGSDFASPVGGTLDPDDFRDLWTVRLGYEYVAILPRVILVPRVGLLMEDLPAASATSNVSTLADVHATRDRWYGATAGLSLCQRRLIWDFGIQVRSGRNVGAGQLAPLDKTADVILTTARLGLTVQF